MKIDIPEGLRREAHMNDDSGLIYPGATMSGMHVEGGREQGKSDGEVELRFNSADAPGHGRALVSGPGPRRATSPSPPPAARARPTSSPAPGRTATAASASAWRPRQGGGTDGRVLALRHD